MANLTFPFDVQDRVSTLVDALISEDDAQYTAAILPVIDHLKSVDSFLFDNAVRRARADLLYTGDVNRPMLPYDATPFDTHEDHLVFEAARYTAFQQGPVGSWAAALEELKDLPLPSLLRGRLDDGIALYLRAYRAYDARLTARALFDMLIVVQASAPEVDRTAPYLGADTAEDVISALTIVSSLAYDVPARKPDPQDASFAFAFLRVELDALPLDYPELF